MSWPDESECIHFVDVSRYENANDWNPSLPRQPGRIDWDRFFEEHPSVQLVMPRASGSGSGPDPDFAHNYDEPVRLGRKAMPYVNNNPTKTSEFMMETWWKPTIGDRDPDVVVHDCESDSGLADSPTSDETITEHIRSDLDLLHAAYRRVMIYTASWFWTPRVSHGWEQDEDHHDAHYVYLVRNLDGTWRVAYNLAEADAAMPYNSLTYPLLPQGFSLAKRRAWQFTEKGRGLMYSLDGRPVEVDLDYMLRPYFEAVFGPPALTVEQRLTTLEAVTSDHELRLVALEV